MIRLKYTRAEWSAIAERVAAADPDLIPPGLAERIEALLRETPSSWPNEPCVIELEPANASAVRQLAAQARGVARAEQILHDHQSGNPEASFRIEHRTEGVSSIVAYLTDRSTLHRELVRHAGRLRATGTTGELVLVDQESLDELARVPLMPEPDNRRPS